MKKSLYVLLLLILPLFQTDVQAQFKRSKVTNNPFLKTQWWLGFRAGTNLTKTTPIEQFSSFSPVNYQSSEVEKEYGSYSTPGLQAGLEFTFFTQGFSVSLQPIFARQFFDYSNSYQWTDPTNQSNSLDLNYEIDNDLEYLDIPLIVKYDLMKTKARPFVQIGGYYSVLLSAGKTINSTGIDRASGGESSFQNEEIKVGAGDIFTTSSAGIVAGAGIAVNQGNIRLVFDVNYRYGLNNITNAKNRYKDDRLASIGDVMDDINLRSIWVSFGAQFPLKFISKEYDAVN